MSCFLATGRRCRGAVHRTRRRMSSSSSSPPPFASGVTVAEALAGVESRLQLGSVPECDLSAAHLVAAAVGVPHNELWARGDLELSTSAATLLSSSVERRLAREPVQYIVGEWGFHDIESLEVGAPVLVPRPETEELVEGVLEWARDYDCDGVGGRGGGGGGIDFLDVGCGTGAIGLALLLHLPAGSRCVGIDTDPVAAAMAGRNAGRLGLSGAYTNLHVGIADFPQRFPSLARSGFDFVVSNPPYIPARDMPALEPEVARYEDEGALCGGEDGLDVIRQLMGVVPGLLRPREAGGMGALWLECDDTHPALLEQWCHRASQQEGAEASSQPVPPHGGGGWRFEWGGLDVFGKSRFCRLVREQGSTEGRGEDGLGAAS